MPALQEQDQNLADPHPVRSQAALPGTSIDEHCGQALHEALGGDSAVGRLRPLAGCQERAESQYHDHHIPNYWAYRPAYQTVLWRRAS